MDNQGYPHDQISDPRERRARLYRTRGIVLRRVDIGEADRIVTIFTDVHGKRRLAAKGSRRPSSRLAGHLEPFSATRLLISRTRGLDIISQAEVVQTFPSLRARESTIATAGYLAQLVDTLMPEDQSDENVHELLFASLRLLDDGRDERLVTHVFEMGMLRQIGFRPELARCVGCGADLEALTNGFSGDGGVLCPRCIYVRPDVMPISVNALKLLRAIDRGEIERLFTLRVPEAVWTEVGNALDRSITRASGRESSAKRVMRELQLE